jgi:hypothetical protein
MNKDLVDVIRIDDPEIDANEVIRQVREGLRTHGFGIDPEFPVFHMKPVAHHPAAHLSAALYHDLEQAALAYGRTSIHVPVFHSRLPLVARLKGLFHRLVVYYIHRYGEQQMVFDGALLRTVNRLVQSLETSENANAALRREIKDLRTRLTQVEAAIGTTKGADKA